MMVRLRDISFSRILLEVCLVWKIISWQTKLLKNMLKLMKKDMQIEKQDFNNNLIKEKEF